MTHADAAKAFVPFFNLSISMQFILLLISHRSGGRDYNNQGEQNHNTYGLSASFLNNLGIQPPLHNKIFIANVSILSLVLFYAYETAESREKWA